MGCVTWLVCNSDSSSRIASKFGALPWITEIHDKLLDLFVVQEAILLSQLQQTNWHNFLCLTGTIVQVPFDSQIVLKYGIRTGMRCGVEKVIHGHLLNHVACKRPILQKHLLGG